MNKFFCLITILISIFHEILTGEHNCPIEFQDCFNCSTCGETELYYEHCPCRWSSNSKSCKNVDNKSKILFFYQAFENCDDSSSALIQEEFCGSSTITIGDTFEFSLPKVYEVYGTRSVYCTYRFVVSEDSDVYYNINYIYDQSYIEQISSVNLYLIVTNLDSTSINGLLEIKEINKDFYGVKSITLRLYFEHSFDSLPFSLIITKKKDNSKITLYITIGVIILSCIICALAIYCLSKKISENARLRQRALFEIAMAHQNGEENDDDEEEEQKRIETENKLKIKFALKHSLKPKKFMKKYGVKDGNTCTICIEDFKENKSRVSITPCKHVFHYQCLSNWMVKNVMNPKCPNCNFNLIQDVKDSDIKDMVVNPERINVTNVKVNNMVNEENNNNNNAHIQNVNVQNDEVTRNVNVNNNTESNTNTEERNLRTSSNVVIIRRDN